MDLLADRLTSMVRVELTDGGFLDDDWAVQLGAALDRAEDLGADGAMLVHVSGQDSPQRLERWPGQTNVQSITRWERALRRIERSNVVTFVVAERACSWLALELLLCGDRRLATPTLYIQLACEKDGWPGMGLFRLTRHIGYGHACKFLMDYAAVDAAAALERGLIDEAVSDPYEAESRIGDILKLAPMRDFAVRRRLMQDSVCTSFEDALSAHLAACDRLLRRRPQC